MRIVSQGRGQKMFGLLVFGFCAAFADLLPKNEVTMKESSPLHWIYGGRYEEAFYRRADHQDFA